MGIGCASGGCEALAIAAGLDTVLGGAAIRIIGAGLIGALINDASYSYSPSPNLGGYAEATAVGFLTAAAAAGFGEAAVPTGETTGWEFNSKLGINGWIMAAGGVFSMANQVLTGGLDPGGLAIAIATGMVGAFSTDPLYFGEG